MLPKQFKNLINYFIKFPGIGSRQATRFVFHLLRQPNVEYKEFLIELANLKNNVKICQNCYFIYDKNGGDEKTCRICSDSKRNSRLICVVEKETDALTIEKTGKFDGAYHILGGNIYDMQEKGNFISGNLKTRIQKLQSDIPDAQIELILALNPTPEGDATASFISRELKSPLIKITRLARGLPRGADLEYADQDTLTHAIQNRN